MSKLRISLTVFFVLLLFGTVDAQKKGTIGFTFSATNANLMLQSAAVNHDFTTIEGRKFISFSADYWYPVNDWLEFETGLNYSLQGFEKIVSNKLVEGSLVAVNQTEDIDCHVVNLPIGVRVGFLNVGFVNGGLLVDIAQHEPGIGSYFGFGIKLESEVGYGIFVNPYVKMHSILPVNFDQNADRILEAGIRLGMSYSFDNTFRKR